MSVALRARQPPSKPHHGKFIYFFSNLRTNQVIYSLEREIHTEKQERILLKQLPFYAKKTVPTKLRKDLWKPFATITFPDAAHGLQAFKLLKEYRMVRDHSWTIATPSIPAEGADGASQILDVNPGGWFTKKERAKLLMDQRATSVADLSHIITRNLNSTRASARERGAEIARLKLWSKIQALALTPAEELKALEDERSTLQSAADTPSHKTQQRGGGQAEKSRLKKRRQRIAEITAHLNRLRKAREAVTFASGGEVEEKMREKWSKTLKYIVQQQVPDRPVISGYNMEKAAARKEAEDNARPVNWPKSTKYDGDAHAPKAFTSRDKIALSSHTPEVDSRILKDLPAESVLIQWANLPDAQFAASWHKNVVHEEMTSRLVEKAERALEREAAQQQDGYDAGWKNIDEPGALPSQMLGSKYKNMMPPEEKPQEKSGWLGNLNPMRMFKSGEARA